MFWKRERAARKARSESEAERSAKRPCGEARCASNLKLETGLEGKEFKMIEVVPCIVTGIRVALNHCKCCNYHLHVIEEERGKGKPIKQVVICGAPRRLPVETVIE